MRVKRVDLFLFDELGLLDALSADPDLDYLSGINELSYTRHDASMAELASLVFHAQVGMSVYLKHREVTKSFCMCGNRGLRDRVLASEGDDEFLPVDQRSCRLVYVFERLFVA